MRLIPVAYLASYTLSLLGNSVAGVALPLIVLQTTGSALGAGWVAAATAVPAVLAGLFMGVVIDRINRRTSSVVTDLVSAGAVAALPVVDAVSGLELGWFVLFGIVGSLGDVPGMTARDALLPAIVRHSGVSAERLMGAREALGAVALLAGPAAAGTLMALFDGSTVLWLTAATSLGAALITLAIPHRVGVIDTATDGGSARPAGSSWRQFVAGWRVLTGSRFLTTVTLISVTSVFVLAALQGLVLPVYFLDAGRPEQVGFVLTAIAAGMLLGAGTYAMAGPRASRRFWLLTGVAGTTAGFAVVAGLVAPWTVFAGAFLVGAFSGVSGSLLGVLMIERVPEAFRGRVMGTQNAITTAAPPAGIMLAAVLTEYGSVRVAAVAVAAVWLVAAIVTLRSQALRTVDSTSAPSEEVSMSAQ
ncbi:MFS transporter [Jiangella alba]|uniref:Multidrug efflux pump Tap n=1 Tax=Jiangella alba TaxID=561176 RepID=A0A1H5PCE7_9ACTN|nr:MFS transporter [Jiangella alba]SEF11603.1 Major Facilitator Superfamily protein [Jiangella alba]